MLQIFKFTNHRILVLTVTKLSCFSHETILFFSNDFLITHAIMLIVDGPNG
jgi:hypothetical protein